MYFITKSMNLNLDILTENMGRINFSKGMNNERKGITDRVEFNDEAL